MGREEYISMFGPTVGDRIRLADTSLWIQIERDAVSQPIAGPFKLLKTWRRPCMVTKSNLVVVSRMHGDFTKLPHF